MKKFLSIVLIAAAFASCNDNAGPLESAKDSVIVTPADANVNVDTTALPADTMTVK